MAKFFVSCPVGFETELSVELKEFWFEMLDLDGLPTRVPFPELNVSVGGVEFETEEHLGYQINLFTKIAGRVLLRLHRFEARYYDQFEKGLKKCPFARFIEGGQTVQLKIESHKSRLNNEKNLLEAAGAGLSFLGYKSADEASFAIYIRIEKDAVTVSLDTTGEHLHRRGYGLHRGEAPIRETLAAFMVRRLRSQCRLDSRVLLYDPFVGSGTLLFEALSWNRPQLHRDYTWLHFSNVAKMFKSESWRKNFRWHSTDFGLEVVGSDSDSKALKALQANAEVFKEVFAIDELRMQFRCGDSAGYTPENPGGKEIWVIANPPYGMRLDDGQAKQIIESTGDFASGICIIHPEKWHFRMPQMNLVSSENFNNQGIRLKLSLFVRRR